MFSPCWQNICWGTGHHAYVVEGQREKEITTICLFRTDPQSVSFVIQTRISHYCVLYTVCHVFAEHVM